MSVHKYRIPPCVIDKNNIKVKIFEFDLKSIHEYFYRQSIYFQKKKM